MHTTKFIKMLKASYNSNGGVKEGDLDRLVETFIATSHVSARNNIEYLLPFGDYSVKEDANQYKLKNFLFNAVKTANVASREYQRYHILFAVNPKISPILQNKLLNYLRHPRIAEMMNAVFEAGRQIGVFGGHFEPEYVELPEGQKVVNKWVFKKAGV